MQTSGEERAQKNNFNEKNVCTKWRVYAFTFRQKKKKKRNDIEYYLSIMFIYILEPWWSLHLRPSSRSRPRRLKLWTISSHHKSCRCLNIAFAGRGIGLHSSISNVISYDLRRVCLAAFNKVIAIRLVWRFHINYRLEINFNSAKRLRSPQCVQSVNKIAIADGYRRSTFKRCRWLLLSAHNSLV